jgi:LmbE family N-acetylglucosaminyl deacetylase
MTSIKKLLIYLLLRISNSSLTGKQFSKKIKLKKFPQISSTDKILIISPHVDDEIICCSGVIQTALKNQAEVKVVYLTNGDGNPISVLSQKKICKPNKFIELGEQRIKEAKMATSLLSLSPNNLLFLGYPDGGIKSMYSTNYMIPFVSPTTKLNFSPYLNSFQSKQKYTGKNITHNLCQIFKKYQPTIIFAPHFKDKDFDHQGANLFTQKIIKKLKNKPQVFLFLVHYPFYPSSIKFKMDASIYPSKKLSSSDCWYSLPLSKTQKQNKLNAIKQNFSQTNTRYSKKFLESFVKNNEIFEK